MKLAYQWRGEPCEVKFGYVIQSENKEKPLYWYNFECYNSKQLDDTFKPDHMVKDNGDHFALIPAVQISQGKSTFVLANHYGIGLSKLIKGGWPNHAHFSLDGEFKESNAEYDAIKEFDLDGYERHESARKDWQRKNYPKEFADMENLRNSMRNHIKNLAK